MVKNKKMKKIIKLIFLLALPGWIAAQTTAKDTVNVKPFEDLTLVDNATLDTSDQLLIYDISAGLFSFRGSIGEIGKAVNNLAALLAEGNVSINGSGNNLTYTNLGQYSQTTTNSIAFVSSSGNIQFTPTTGRTSMLGKDFRVGTDSIAASDKHSDLTTVLVRNSSGDVRAVTSLLPQFDTLTMSGATATFNLDYAYDQTLVLDATSASATTTLTISNPSPGTVLDLSFINVGSTLTITFSYTKRSDHTTASSFQITADGDKIFKYRPNGTWWSTE